MQGEERGRHFNPKFVFPTLKTKRKQGTNQSIFLKMPSPPLQIPQPKRILPVLSLGSSMALPKFLLFFIFTSLCYTLTASNELSDSVVTGDVVGAIFGAKGSDDSGRFELGNLEASDTSLRDGLDELNSKISFIGSKVDKKMQELSSKEKTIKELERIIKEKPGTLTALQWQMQSLKEKASLNAKAQEINNIQKEIEAQNKKKDALEARVTMAERKIEELLLKLENLHSTNDEQKSRILGTQHAIQVAEEEFIKVKLEAASISKQVCEDRIPPWLAVYIDHFQSFVLCNWNKHGRPALDLALEKKSEYEKLLRPHVHTFRSATRNSIESHVLRLQQGMHPYFQEVKKFMEPYVKNFLHGYKEFVRIVNALHQQVQAAVLGLLKGHEYTRPLASKESVWYMASALMTLPLIFMFNMVCALFLEKPKKHVHTSHSSYTRSRAKLVHSER